MPWQERNGSNISNSIRRNLGQESSSIMAMSLVTFSQRGIEPSNTVALWDDDASAGRMHFTHQLPKSFIFSAAA